MASTGDVWQQGMRLWLCCKTAPLLCFLDFDHAKGKKSVKTLRAAKHISNGCLPC